MLDLGLGILLVIYQVEEVVRILGDDISVCEERYRCMDVSQVISPDKKEFHDN